MSFVSRGLIPIHFTVRDVMSVIRFFFTICLFWRSDWLCCWRTYGGCHTALSDAVDCRSVDLLNVCRGIEKSWHVYRGCGITISWHHKRGQLMGCPIWLPTPRWRGLWRCSVRLMASAVTQTNQADLTHADCVDRVQRPRASDNSSDTQAPVLFEGVSHLHRTAGAPHEAPGHSACHACWGNRHC